jgi:hypothetical protein
MKKIILFIGMFYFVFGALGQSDSSAIKERRNIIKWNLTPLALVGPGSIVLSYERVLKNGQSFNVGGGLLRQASRTNKLGESIQFFEAVKRGGFDINADYRFFFKKRNANPAPDGLYWGPYTSLYHLNFEGNSRVFENDVQVNSVAIKTDFYMYNLGIQLGYQFIIKDRFAIDLFLVGPSYTHYNFNVKFDSQVALDPNSDFYQDFEKILSTLLPGSEVILDNVDFSTGGRASLNFIGYRYGVQIGYKF